MQEKLLFLVGQVTRLLSSIIKNYRTLQGESISIGIEKTFDLQESEPVEEKKLQVQEDYKKVEQEARNKAKKILSDAKIQAEALLEEAHLQKEKLLSSCYEEIQRLKQEATDKILLDQKHTEETINNLLEEAYKEKQSILAQAEPELVEILQVLLHTIIDVKITSGIEWLTLLVKKMVESEHIYEAVKVHVPSSLYHQYAKDLEGAFEDLRFPVEIEPSGQLEETSCLVETQVGSIYYDIREGLQKVLDEIKILSAINGG